MDKPTKKTRAPGKHWRKGLTLVELIRKFPDDKTAEAWIASIRWPDGPSLPRTATTTTSSTRRPTRRCPTGAAATDAGGSSR